MNKAEQREVQKAVNFAKIDPRFAAATLSGVMRATLKRSSFLEMVQVMNDTGLRAHMTVENGCYVPKPDVETQEALERRAVKADARRFTGEPITGFGSLA